MKIFYGIVSLILAFGYAYGTYDLFHVHLKLFNKPATDAFILILGACSLWEGGGAIPI